MRILPGLVVSVWLAGAAPAAAGPEPAVDDTRRVDLTATTRVPVLVYSAVPDLAIEDLQAALDVAEHALSTASVDIVWTVCQPGACLTPEPTALKIRIVRSPHASATDTRHLGHALIDSRTQTGVLATVFVDRTRRLAGALGIDHQGLLGHTIAHELGHLLLATPTHGNAGLMREIWSREELLGTRHTDWVFDPRDAAVIRARLLRLRGTRPEGRS